MRIIDLSLPIKTSKQMGIKVTYQTHTFGRLAILLNYGLSSKYLRSGLGWANELLKLYTTSTTHLEAPWHYAPVSEGKPARTIDQIPLEWCYAPGVKLDMRHRGDGEEISLADVQEALARIAYTLKPLDIVLIQTGNDQYFEKPEYYTRGSGMSAQATRYLLEAGIKIMGIDSCVWDLPLPQLARKAKASGRNNVFWEAHYLGLEHEWCCLERLTNLDLLPPRGFTVSCLPLKVKDGAAGPVRAVALMAD